LNASSSAWEQIKNMQSLGSHFNVGIMSFL